MKVEVILSTDRNETGRMELIVDGKRQFCIGCLSESPEDAMLERDLNFVYNIPELMQKAYEAGKNGDSFEIVKMEE